MRGVIGVTWIVFAVGAAAASCSSSSGSGGLRGGSDATAEAPATTSSSSTSTGRGAGGTGSSSGPESSSGSSSGAGTSSGAEGGSDAARPSNGTGTACTKNGDCPSGICQPIGGDAGSPSAVCTTTCTSPSDCVAGWTCAPEVGQSSNVCQCTASTQTCDGKDDDCDGIVDDEPAADQWCASQSGPAHVCQGGNCVCATMCGGQCVDEQTDPNNCGGCGMQCSAVCAGAKCVLPTAIAVGDGFACALLANGAVECWGNGCALANGPRIDAATPLAVPGLTGVTAISAGTTSACALLSGGTVACWGSTSYGALGNGMT